MAIIACTLCVSSDSPQISYTLYTHTHPYMYIYIYISTEVVRLALESRLRAVCSLERPK